MNPPHTQDGAVVILVRFPHHQQIPDRGDNPHRRDIAFRETGFEDEPDIRPVPDRAHPASIYLRDTLSGFKSVFGGDARRGDPSVSRPAAIYRPWAGPPLGRTLDAASGPATIRPQPIDPSEGETHP